MADEKKAPSKDERIEITKTQFQTLNLSVSFKGEDIWDISMAFADWCKEMEKEYSCAILAKNDNFNGYWPIDRTRTKD